MIPPFDFYANEKHEDRQRRKIVRKQVRSGKIAGLRYLPVVSDIVSNRKGYYPSYNCHKELL